jgi:hypothetical protein
MFLADLPGYRSRRFFGGWRGLGRSRTWRGGGLPLPRGLFRFALRGLRFELRGLFGRRLLGLVGFRYFESIEPAQLYRYVFID